MKIIEITANKKEYLDLLLLADEQEDMVDRYLEKGKMYVLDDNGVKCECVITDEGNGILEIKNTDFPFNSVLFCIFTPQIWSFFTSGRGRRTRTLPNGFGDRHATTDTIPL